MKNTVPDGHENCTIHDRFCVSAHTRGIVEKRNLRDIFNVYNAGMFARQEIFTKTGVYSENGRQALPEALCAPPPAESIRVHQG